MTEAESYQIHALRYATREARAGEHFIGGDPHDGPMPMDYFVWAIVNDNRRVVVDTGFGAEEADRRQRTLLRSPKAALAAIGIQSAQVEDVIITHLHYDHAGTLGDFPAARFHLQDLEMSYATGRHMGDGYFAHAYTVEDVVQMVRKVFDGRVVFHGGDSEFAPGITLHHLGGHTMGLQVVRVRTARGWVVLASDASHMYANMEQGRPFPIVYSVGDMFNGYARMRALAESPAHIVPGHDPLVMARYPASAPDLAEFAVRLDLPPLENT